MSSPSTLGTLNKSSTNASKKTPRKANCAQKSTTPKKGKFMVILLRKVETTDGVHTFLAAALSASSEHGRMWNVWFVQSGSSPGLSGGCAQYVCGPKVAYCGATIIEIE